MSERKFIVWEVWAVQNGRETCLVTLPYRQHADATTWATYIPRAYVMRGTADREPAVCSAFSTVVSGKTVQLTRGMKPAEPQPVPAREPTAQETPIVQTKIITWRGRRRFVTFATG